jgi:ubiquinone/menaquinone biosynthesis C-methylase UbiE
MIFNYIYMVEFAEKYAANNPDATILDYGCGSGDVVIAGRERGLNFFGADVFYGGADSAKARIEKSGWMGVAIKEIVDGKLDFPDRQFDLVVCNQVFEHVEDLDAVLLEIHRVLKPGGDMLALFPVLDTWREGHCGIPFVTPLQKGYRTAKHAKTAKKMQNHKSLFKIICAMIQHF